MNPLQSLASGVREAIPAVSLTLREPLRVLGLWTLDARLRLDTWVVVQWSESKGFGISRLGFDHAYGEGPQDVTSDEAAALEKVLGYLRQNVTSP